MTYSNEVEQMCTVKKGPHHGPAPIPEEGKWVKSYQISDISGFSHGIGWCAPQQGACKLSLNVKNGIVEEALVETVGCSGMTHSAAMAAEILPGKTLKKYLYLLLAGVPEHRPGVRRHQCGYARDLQAAGLRSFSVRIL